MKFAVYGKHLAEAVVPLFQALVDKLEPAGGPLYLYEPFFRSVGKQLKFNSEPLLFTVQEDIRGKADILFSIGGDGTMLDAVTLVGDSGILLAGINLGRLGFLTSISREKIIPALDAILDSDFKLDQRTLLKLETGNGLFSPVNFALNEITVYKAKPMSMLTIQTWVDGDFLNSYWADGLIVSTPTGSTAYSLSSTGPIIAPDAGSLVITPIASHNLTVRPVVLRDDVVIRILVGGEKTSFFVSMDSRVCEVANPLELIIRKADFRINLLRLRDASFFNTLRDKLNWGLDVRN
ncbi:MAG: NAD kinase [Bacteroidetes bacterium]|nr:NAD kinase [Bacteroidota bacterium]